MGGLSVFQGIGIKPCGLDPAIFNLIFTLVTGTSTVGSGSNQRFDVWDYEPGVKFFGDILFNNCEVSGTYKNAGKHRQKYTKK